MSPTERLAASSNTGVHVVPWLSLFHTPPEAVPT